MAKPVKRKPKSTAHITRKRDELAELIGIERLGWHEMQSQERGSISRGLLHDLVSSPLSEYGKALSLDAHSIIRSAAKKKAKESQKLRVCDLGHGKGIALQELASDKELKGKVELVGVDVTRTVDPEMKKKFLGRIKFRVGYAQNLKELFPANHFDFIISNYLPLSHADIALDQIYRALKPGGDFIGHLVLHMESPESIHRMSREEIERFEKALKKFEVLRQNRQRSGFWAFHLRKKKA